MVAGAGHDTRLQDRRYSFSSGPTQWAGNSTSCPLAPSLLAYITIRQFCSLRAVERDHNGHPDTLRARNRGSVGMILELERGFRGLVQVSPQAMNQAVAALQADATNENSG